MKPFLEVLINAKIDIIDALIDLIKPETDKIDGAATDGLSGVNNSLAYRVNEIERHLHSPERWIGLAASPVGETHCADKDVMTPFRLTSGNDTYGAWVQILGSEDGPFNSGGVKFDVHRLLVTDVTTSYIITRLQIAYGATGDDAVAAGDYTEVMITPVKDEKQDPFEIQERRITYGTKVWARHWVKASNAKALDFFYGVHEYNG